MLTKTTDCAAFGVNSRKGGCHHFQPFCSCALARSEAKAGQPALVAGYIGKSHALAYADQNEAGYAALKKAVESGAVSGLSNGYAINSGSAGAAFYWAEARNDR